MSPDTFITERATLHLADGKELDKSAARFSVLQGGVLKVIEGDEVTLYAPGQWEQLDYTQRQRARPRSAFSG